MLSTVAKLGLPAALRFAVQRRRMAQARDRSAFTLTSKHARHPLLCRANTTDLPVFRQIFLQRDYRCLDPLQDAELIVDCGANVGYSAAYFLSRFPRAELIAIEPDPGNFELLERNLAPYGGAARMLRSAVWSHPARLVLSEDPYRGGEWARQVRECLPHEEPAFLGVDIGSLLAGSRHDRISILKIDIEGAEGVVFAANFEPWIDRVDYLAVELHDDSSFGDCSAIFHRAIAGRGFTVTRHGEMTVCARPGRGGPSRP
jgi:FkbM family methyltransferase